jgi:hypothetical protein
MTKVGGRHRWPLITNLISSVSLRFYTKYLIPPSFLSSLTDLILQIVDNPNTDDVSKVRALKRLTFLAKARALAPSLLISSVTDNAGKYDPDEFIRGGGFCVRPLTLPTIQFPCLTLMSYRMSVESPSMMCLFVSVSSTEIYPRIWTNSTQYFVVKSWILLDHPNVVPLVGASLDVYRGRHCYILPWMDNGTIINFIKTHPEYDKFAGVRLRL